MEKQDDLVVITKTRKLIEYIFTVTEKSPSRSYRVAKFMLQYFTADHGAEAYL